MQITKQGCTRCEKMFYRHSALLLCSAYILGLLSSGCLNFFPLVIAWGIFTLVVTFIFPRYWRLGPPSKLWLLAGMISIVAVIYLQWRSPLPEPTDISQRLVPVPGKSESEFIKIKGKILSNPKLTRSENLQFWLEAIEVDRQRVTGKIYVTAKKDQAANLKANQKLTISGILYLPQPSPNPGGFDFRAYLKQRGTFSALKAVKIVPEPLEPSFWDFVSSIADRIITAQIQGLGEQKGTLVASMVLGSAKVDLPYDLRDQFIQAGLAHVLAASGFQVSFLLGVVLSLTRRLSVLLRFFIGLFSILIYVSLTGIQPSVMRAAVMGFAALIAVVTNRKIKPFGSLVFAATILLLINPLWIWDLGFQLSFLATLGLIVTLPPLLKYLDWLPEAIATIIAIPIAASVWTLPLLIYVFSSVALYSIVSNVLAAPLIALISLGGMISALVAVVWIDGGGAIAYLVNYPTQWLIDLVAFINQMPGNSLAVGKISLGVLIVIYGAFIVVCLNNWWQRRWYLVGLFSLTIIILPVISQKAALAEQVRVTVLAAKEDFAILIQDHGKVIIIDSASAETARYTLLPLLNQRGINSIDTLIRLNTDAIKNKTWQTSPTQSLTPKQLLSNLPLVPLSQPLSIGKTYLRQVSSYPPILELEVSSQTWLLLGDTKVIPEVYQLIQTNFKPFVLIFSGRSLKKQWLELIKPKMAIALTGSVHHKTKERFAQEAIDLYWTGRDGAMEWTELKGLQRFFDTTDIMI